MVSVLKKAVMLLLTVFPSPVRIVTYRMLGFKIGKRVTVSIGAVLVADDMVIDDYANVRALTLVNVHRLEMGRYSIIASLAVVNGRGSLFMSDRCRVSTSCLLDCTDDIRLGHYCGIGPRNNLYTHASYLPVTLGYPNHHKGISLGNYVWTGIQNTIMPGTTSGDHVVTLPNLVLSGHIPGDTCLTSKGPKSIDIVRRKRPMATVFAKLISGIDESIPVFCSDLPLNTRTVDSSEIIILINPDRAAIDAAVRHRKTLVAFYEVMPEGLIAELDALRVDWYDFTNVEMASIFHSRKSIMLSRFDDLGGLKFLEQRRDLR